jgi:hypothetical protein
MGEIGRFGASDCRHMEATMRKALKHVLRHAFGNSKNPKVEIRFRIHDDRMEFEMSHPGEIIDLVEFESAEAPNADEPARDRAEYIPARKNRQAVLLVTTRRKRTPQDSL